MLKSTKIEINGGFSRSIKAPIRLPVSATERAGNNQISIGMTSERTKQRMIERLRENGIIDEAVLEAMARVPRHIFIDEALSSRAYEDVSLPIGLGQTISQPFVVADMIARLRAGRNMLGRTLEVGSGCGYQAAVLAQLCSQVHSIERILSLKNRASKNLANAKITNVSLYHGDGYAGLPNYSPFDSIIVAAATEEMPVKLLEQLAIGGRLILPIGGEQQNLHLIERTAHGYTELRVYGVHFVPMLAGITK